MKNSNFKSIAETDILSDKQLDSVEAGVCSSGCKPSCQQGSSGHHSSTSFEVCPKSVNIKISTSSGLVQASLQADDVKM